MTPPKSNAPSDGDDEDESESSEEEGELTDDESAVPDVRDSTMEASPNKASSSNALEAQ